MERKKDIVLAILFFVFLSVTVISTRTWNEFVDLLTLCVTQNSENGPKTSEDGSSSLTISTISDEILDKLICKNMLVELSGTIMKSLGVQSYYNTTAGINITSDGYNIGQYSKTSTHYEVEQMIDFKEYLDGRGTNLLYVSLPVKYIDDVYYQQEFGGNSFVNSNTDLFLSRIEQAGISYIDLRNNIIEEQLEPLSLFYRTDHHWTVPASKWAAKIISERLNRSFGYNIDLRLFDDSNFNSVYYENAWLGEQGKKVAKSYIGLDDYTMMEPMYETSYTITGTSGVVESDFSGFINKEVYNLDANPYASPSWHYSYIPHKECNIHNNNAGYGKVLVLGDSYSTPMIPFLTLGIQDVRLIVPRDLSDTTIRQIVEAGDYDTVIIAYAQFMIGAHDSESNANYKMFDLK